MEIKSFLLRDVSAAVVYFSPLGRLPKEREGSKATPSCPKSLPSLMKSSRRAGRGRVDQVYSAVEEERQTHANIHVHHDKTRDWARGGVVPRGTKSSPELPK